MTGKIMESRTGEFATSKGHILPEDIGYIAALSARGYPEQSICKMSGFDAAAVRRALTIASIGAFEPRQEEPAAEARDIIHVAARRDILWIRPPSNRGRQIATNVAHRYGLTFAAIEGQSRQRVVAHARQHIMWELRKQTKLSLPQIGRLLGGRDHSTIIHGIRAHEARMAAEREGAAA